MKRTKLFALLAAFVVALGIFAASAFAADPAPSLSIKTFNLSVENAVYMVFKVADESVETGDTRLLVWEDVPSEYKKGTEDACLTSNEVESGTGYTVFRYTDLAAKDMTKTVYACAYANVNGTEVYSAPVKYSIVMYADMKKTAKNPDEDLVAFLDTMLAYGAAAQTYFGHNTGFLATDEVHKVTVVNGTLSDGFLLGWVKEGTTVTVTANAPAEGYVFSHWADATGASVATTETAELPVDKVETYTAVYKAAPTPNEYFSFTKNTDGTYSIAAASGYTLPINTILPDTYNGAKVTAIASQGFYNKSSIVSIVIPDSVTSIGSDAFNYCTKLERIEIPASVTSMSAGVFAGCTKLESINVDPANTAYHSSGNCLIDTKTKTLLSGCNSSIIPSDGSVTKIGYRAFYKCGDLRNLTEIPEGVTTIYGDAFRYASGLDDLTIGASVQTINSSAFSYSDVKSVTFADSSKLTSLPYEVFSNCTALTSVDFGKNTSLTEIGAFAFSNTALTSIEIPSTVTEIDYYAFEYCEDLCFAFIPSSVKTVGYNVFYGCAPHLLIACAASAKPSGWDNRWSESYSDDSDYGIYSPFTHNVIWNYGTKGVDWGKTANGLHWWTVGSRDGSGLAVAITKYSGSDATVVIPEKIGSYAVEWIYEQAFAYNKTVQQITVPDTVWLIEDRAFRYSPNLTRVILGDGVTFLGDRAFEGCTALTEVVIGEGVGSIAKYCFMSCDALARVYYRGDATAWSKISGNTNIENATVYYYADTAPTDAGNFWHYNEYGLPVVWEITSIK